MKHIIRTAISLVFSTAMVWLFGAGSAAALTTPPTPINPHPVLLAQTGNGGTEAPAEEAPGNKPMMNQDQKKGAEEEKQGMEEEKRGMEEERRGMREEQKGMEEEQRGVEEEQRGVEEQEKGMETEEEGD